MKSSFARKVGYMGLAVLLFVIILVVREPINRERTEHKLAEATLGNVDPTSSTMLVVLGGLRGVASNILWIQAQELQMQHDWTNLKVVVDSITTLEPHFVSVWTFQGWNQAYNVSAEWDQVADKYYWIKEGIRFLKRGTEANEDSPELRWDVGWTLFHKIGRADEAELLRKLHRADRAREVDAQGRVQDAFNPDGLDNFMMSYGWFVKAVEKCDLLKVKPKRMGEVAFRSYPAHALIDFATAHEKEGNFGERIQAHWLNARQALQQFADYDFKYTPTKAVHLDYPPEIFADLYRSTSVYTDSKELNEAINKKLDSLTEEQRLALPAKWEKLLTETDRMITEFNKPTIGFLPPEAAAAFDSLTGSFDKLKKADVAELCQPGAGGDAVRKLVADFAAAAESLGKLADEELYWCDRYATMINYRYWLERALCEYQSETVAARQHFFDGDRALKSANLELARTEFEAGLELWKSVMDNYPRVQSDDLTAEDTVAIVKSYLTVRTQLDLPDLKDDEIPFRDLIARLTPHMPTPEEYEAMRQVQMAQPDQPGDGGAMKKMLIEKIKGKVQGTLKPGNDASPDQSPEDKKQ